MPATELVAMVIANPALYLADSKLAQAHAISPTHEPQQRSAIVNSIFILVNSY